MCNTFFTIILYSSTVNINCEYASVANILADNRKSVCCRNNNELMYYIKILSCLSSTTSNKLINLFIF